MDYYEECAAEAKAGYYDWEREMDRIDKAINNACLYPGIHEYESLDQAREAFTMEYYGVARREFEGTFEWANFPHGEPNINPKM